MKHPLRTGAALLGAALLLSTGLASAEVGDPPRTPDNAIATGPVDLVRTNAGTAPSYTEDQYVAVTPCRIVDSRAAGGALGAGVTRTFYVGGTQHFVAQGGKSGGCGIPIGATGISAIVTSINGSSKGYLRAFPSNKAEPTATVLSYPGHTDVGTGASVSIDPATANSLKVKNYAATSGLVIDVTGYTIAPMAAVILPAGGQYSGTSRIVSATRVSTGEYDVVLDRSILGCQPMVTMHGGNYYASAYENDTNRIRITTWDVTGSPATATPKNLFVTLNVVC